MRCAVVVLDAAWRDALPGVERLVRRAARAAFAGSPRGPRALVVALSNDRQVRALNARDRHKDKPTNVLSYPSKEPGYAGDVILARQIIWREARAQNKTPADHVTHLVLHGALHLLGHDHEDAAEAKRMEALERRILARLGVADPYEVF